MNVQTFGQVTLHLEILAPPPKKKKILDKGLFGVGTFQLKCSPLHPYAERPQLFISTNAY